MPALSQSSSDLKDGCTPILGLDAAFSPMFALPSRFAYHISLTTSHRWPSSAFQVLQAQKVWSRIYDAHWASILVTTSPKMSCLEFLLSFLVAARFEGRWKSFALPIGAEMEFCQFSTVTSSLLWPASPMPPAIFLSGGGQCSETTSSLTSRHLDHNYIRL